MFTFPEWSDLSNVSDPTKHNWNNVFQRREEYRRYFEGDIFKDTVPLEASNGEEEPLLYPVGLNLVKMLCLAQTDAAFGEWDDQIVNFEADNAEEITVSYKNAIKIANNILKRSNGNSLFWELELDRNIYGGCAARVMPTLEKPNYVSWKRVPLSGFFPIWDPADEDNLLSVYIKTAMTNEQARLRYGFVGEEDFVTKIEKWTRGEYTTTLDGKRIDKYSGINPWGIVPFVYIPRFRTGDWWGEALTEDIMKAQDELNMRVADMGEAINYNSHPTRWGLNLPKSFNEKNFPLAPNALWDLGRVIGQSPPPQVGILEAKAAVSPAAFDYVSFLYDWIRTSTFAPPIAFGEDNGGGQRSGATLEIRMWPLIKSVRRSRSYMSQGIIRLLRMSAIILQQKQFSDVPSNGVSKLFNMDIKPVFANILPKDHQAVVDEVVKLLSTDPPAISIETAQKELGRDISEVERIKNMLEDKRLQRKEEKSNDVQEAMQGKMTPQTGGG